ncbi:MAG: class 1 fructose-bisphosphatase [Alphaproteobacteria bacterium]|nr:MAG: class 1 fructose-bisphosphatase [Alphaproteobacteria bacterium]
MDLKTFLEKNYSIDSLNKVILDLSNAAIKISNSIRNNYKLENKKETSQNVDGDKQKPLDIFADECVFESLNNSSVAAYCSEEQDGMTTIDKNGKYLIFCDPLDGSSNIGNNISIGTIFSILPFYNGSIENSLKQNGNSQLCAGFFVYGPQTTLILSLGKGVHSFYFDNKNSQFNILNPDIIIPKSTSEFSINSSYRRYWNDKVKNYIKNCEDGSDGIREKNFNMRWVGSLVADASRIFERGGIFLYPQDKREKNKSGRLRLTYEANPISFLISQAGGKATNGSIDILNVEVNEIHQRVPFIFGSEEEVDIFLNTE